VCPGVVRPDRHSTEAALIEVDRAGVINAIRVRRETCYRTQETLSLERPYGGDCIESCERWGTGRESCRHIRGAEIRRQCLRSAIKSAHGVQLRLGQQLCTFGS